MTAKAYTKPSMPTRLLAAIDRETAYHGTQLTHEMHGQVTQRLNSLQINYSDMGTSVHIMNTQFQVLSESERNLPRPRKYTVLSERNLPRPRKCHNFFQ